MEKDSFSKLDNIGIELEKVSSFLYLTANSACSEGLAGENYTTAMFDLHDRCNDICQKLNDILMEEFPRGKEVAR